MNTQTSPLSIVDNLEYRALTDRNDFRAVYDLSGGFCKLSLWIAKMNLATGGHKMFTSDKYEKAFIGRGHVIATIASVAASGNTLELTLAAVGTPPQQYESFRVHDLIAADDFNVQAKVVEKVSPGVIRVEAASSSQGLADLQGVFAAGVIVKAIGDASPNNNSGGKERLAEYPETDFNYSAIKRDSWYASRRENIASRVTMMDGGLWSEAGSKQTLKRLLKGREKLQIFGNRDQYASEVGGLTDTNGGIRWSVMNRGGVYLPLSSPLTENQFDNWLSDNQSRKLSSGPMDVFLGQGMLMHIQRNFTEGYITQTGTQNTFGGQNVEGLNVLEYNIANMPVRFIELDVLRDRELFPELSTIAGLTNPYKRQHMALTFDTAPIPTSLGERPAIELISRDPYGKPFHAGIIPGMDKSFVATAESMQAAAGNVVTDLDSSSIHFLIDDGIDMTGKFAGMIETVI
jgi:hypothetical protein